MFCRANEDKRFCWKERNFLYTVQCYKFQEELKLLTDSHEIKILQCKWIVKGIQELLEAPCFHVDTPDITFCRLGCFISQTEATYENTVIIFGDRIW